MQRFAILFLFSLSFNLHLQAQKVDSLSVRADSLITNFLELTGGAANWEKLNSLKYNGTIKKYPQYSLLQTGPDSIKIEKNTFLFKFPDSSKHINWTTPEPSYVITTKSHFIIKTSFGKVNIVENPYHGSDIYAFPAKLFTKKDLQYEYLGRENINGKECHVINVKMESWRLWYKYYFDSISGLLYARVSDQSITKRITYVTDYKKVNDFTFHTTETSYVNGVDKIQIKDSMISYYDFEIDIPISIWTDPFPSNRLPKSGEY